jgi:hypothetical protein
MSEDHFYEMLWDCPSCRTTGLLGNSQRHCPVCGQAQNPAKRYFPEPGKEVEAQGHAFVGADWRCAYCDSPNSAAASFCCNCGAPKDGTKPVGTIADPLEAAARPALASGMRSRRGLYAGLAALVLLLGGIAGLFFSKKETLAQVTQSQWQREIEVERFAAVSDSAWCDAMPAAAYAATRSQEVRSHRQVADGQECKEKRVDKGDGTFVKQQECSTRYREEPVYDMKCHFTIDRWHVVRKLKASGDSGQLPTWPTADAGLHQSAGPTGRLGEERSGQRHENYVVTLANAGKSWQCDVKEEAWGRLKPGIDVAVQIRAIGGPVCDSIQVR